MEKLTFGEFLAKRRTEKSLTQKELAAKLFVGESAVSKWEADKRRPDLELVTKLSEILGVTESELIRASVDLARAAEKQQARNFRIINGTYNLTLFIGFGITLLTCFICNLAVQGTLSWFFIVLASLVLVGTVLILPQYIRKHKILIIPAAFLGALYLLLGVCCIYTGGNWFFVPAFALLFAYSIIFVPVLIHLYLPKLKRFNSLLSISAGAVLLAVMLVVIDIYTKANGTADFGWSFAKGLPIVLFYLVPTYATAVLLQFIKINWAFKVSAIIALFTVFYDMFFLFLTMIKLPDSSGRFWRANLAKWSSDALINSNVEVLVNIGLMLTAIAFLTVGILMQCKTARKVQ
jgi:transcriptional regulator with XRE-family HTH domain